VSASSSTGRAGGAAEQRSASTPRAVTRGERVAGQRAKVDWLNATFPAPALSVEGLVGLLARMLGRPVSATEGRGMLGFASSVQLHAHVGSRKALMGSIAYGGESQGGRWLLQFTGAGCGFVTDWEGVQALLDDLGAKVTRVDLAVDFLEGEYTVDDAVRMHEEGGFSSCGRPPSTSVAGDWLGKLNGRTLYVGKATNGKLLRVYEKGRQLGDSQSEWVRFEVQLGSRDRVIPLDVLTRTDAYFAGCYPALAAMLAEAAEKIPTQQTQGHVTLGHLLHHLKRCYGKVLDVVHTVCGAPVSELVEEVRVIGVPRRLLPSALESGLSWSQVQDQHKRAQ
jgi:phage replication initiation protein